MDTLGFIIHAVIETLQFGGVGVIYNESSLKGVYVYVVMFHHSMGRARYKVAAKSTELWTHSLQRVEYIPTGW